MRIVVLLFAVGAFVVCSATALDYDANVTPDVIFGSGNANGGFTVDQQSNGVELGLRGHIPYTGVINSNGDGTYSYTSADILASSADTWNFDWTVNTNWDGGAGYNIDDLTYLLEFDSNASAGVSFIAFDPITPGAVPWFDHSIGTNATGNGAGTEATDASSYAGLIANNNVLQQSWRGVWMPGLGSFDPLAVGTYDIRLSAYTGTTQLASTSIQVLINGGAPVPEPASMALLGMGIVGLAATRIRKQRNAA